MLQKLFQYYQNRIGDQQSLRRNFSSKPSLLALSKIIVADEMKAQTKHKQISTPIYKG